MRKAALLAAVAAPAIGIWATPAFAQETEEPKTSSAYVANGDIIVTARKRQESILKVPVIETVLTPEVLADRQVTNITGLTQQVAGLQIGNNVLSVGAQISLRGVGTSSLDAGVDQSVSLNIDGLQLTQGASYAVGMFDMQQVEVLKGPQALFFGKNSPGGVISIRTADPGDELEVIARATYGFEAREKRGELIYSGPLSDTVGIRIAGMYSDDDGYFFNKATAAPGTGAKTPSSNRYNATEEYILRGTLVWKPDADVNVRLKVNNTKKRVIGGGAPMGSCPDGNGAPAGIPFINPADDCKIDRNVYIVDVLPSAFPEARNGGTPFQQYVTSFGTLEIGYNVAPQISLTSTTGYYNTRFDGLLNGVNSGFAGPTLIADNRFKRRDWTQELRLESDFSTPLNFLLGGYYQNARVSNRIWVGGNTAYGFPGTLTSGINDVKIEAWSLFGQLRWKPVDVIEIAGGVRYADERRHDDAASATSYFSALTPITIANPTLRAKNWSPELTITYTPTDDLTVFGALKQGYKSGSFIMTVPATPGGDNSFGDERVRGGEVGIKARLADRALSIESAFYYYKYDNLQVGANEVAQGGLPVIRTINAGKSTVYGVDFEATYRPPSLEGLSARLAVNWNHARFTEFANAPCAGGQTIAEGCNRVLNPTTGRFQAQDLAGLPLPKAADWTANGGLDYDATVGGGLQLGLGVNVQYSSKFLKNLGRRADFFQPSFAKLNANVSLASENDSWELALIGNNLTNKYTAGNCTQFSGATGQVLAPPLSGAPGRNASGVDELACIADPGRQVFLRLTLRPTAF
ncbi:TonB-dependent receptor [Novosphingobium sp. PS1R-30]|uniref:TonB-dependent receptor n=1 Tax=Novosphingobium anseongense TaxID=3133436 RepID=A0ABU8RV69_9SPHN